MRRAVLACLALASVACRGEAPGRFDEDERFARLVDSLVPVVEEHSGLVFLQAPRAALRTKDQVRGYLVAKVEQEEVPGRLEGMTAAYRLLGLLPDSLDLQRFMVELYTEQVAGYYDPDSAMLFGVTGFDPLQAKLLVAHELVHALQDQYMALDSILDLHDESDRQGAAQAILEGQAMIVALRALVPDPSMVQLPMFWEQAREATREQTAGQPIFRSAPLVLRESMLFPYLDGAEFMRWWAESPMADSMPFGARMPESSEQILHPERYASGDRPLRVRFTEPADGVLHEDTLGELDLRIITAQLTDQAEVGDRPAFGWGGDRYRLWQTPDGPALVWVVAWDSAAAGERFGATTGRWIGELERPGYRTVVTPETVGGHPAHRVTIAPAGWAGWTGTPGGAVEVRQASRASGSPGSGRGA